MDGQDLARWTRFAAKGGIGRCTATRDCVAQNTEDLMFLQDDEIVVLMLVSASEGLYLGFCEGVVGKFSGADVKFHGKLKKPIITRRPGSVTANTSTSPALSAHPVVPSPTPSDSSPFHLDKSDIEPDVQTTETGPSDHSYGQIPSSFSHERSSRPTTRESSIDRSPGSDSSSVETPARPSEEQPSRSFSIEVVDEQGHLSPPPLPDNLVSGPVAIREEKARASASVNAPFASSHRQEVVSAIYAPPAPGVAQPLASNIGLDPGTDEDTMSRDAASPTEPPQGSKSGSVSHAEEPYSPASQYTKEEGGPTSEDSHIQRASTLTVSDGGFGIGLSLLQGLANNERGSRAWSESEADDASVHRSSQHINSASSNARKSITASSTTANVKAQRQSAVSNQSSTEGGQKARSESDNGDSGYGWDDDDLLEDYRYSRYSLGSKASKQSRNSTVPSISRSSAVPSIKQPSRMPPLPDDPRPSIDGSVRSISNSSPPPTQNAAWMNPKPLNIIKNNAKTATSPTPTFMSSDQERGAGASTTPLGMASALRQRIDEENEKNVPNQFDTRRKSDQLTPRPSADKLSQSVSTTVLPPSSSNDYNGDESEDESSPEVETTPGAPNDPLSPTSTAGSTNSLFLPHPGAPKPLMNNGQIAPRPAAIHIANATASYSSSSQASSPSSPEAQRNIFNGNRGNALMSMPAVVSLVATLSMAAARARNVKGTTLYGKTQADLLSAPGPVPIAFSLDGHPPSPRAQEPGFPRQPPKSPASPVGLGINTPAGGNDLSGQQQPIPRANFFPKKGVPRPRSRSFSGFSVNDTDVLIPVARSQEEGSKPLGDTSLSAYQASFRGGSPVGQGQSPSPSPQFRSRSPSRGPARTQRPTHVPSPLSLPAISRPDSTALDPPRGLSQTGPPSPNMDPSRPFKGHGLRQVSSNGLLRLGSGQNEVNGPRIEVSTSRTSNEKREGSPTKPNPIRRSTTQADEPERDRSDLTVPSLVHPGSSSSPTPLGRSISLRSKLSMSTLRAKNSTGRPSRDSSEPQVPILNVPGNGPDDEDRVQVKDMEFELVRPVLKTSGLRTSEEHAGAQVTSPESESIRSGVDGQTSWRTESPAFSPATSHSRSPNVKAASMDSLANFRNPSAIQAASIEAHRIREQKWMTLISSTPSSQARKSKKVKRLIIEGVPSSVRGKVWGLITDSKARRMEGLFSQLVKKAPKQIIPLVEQDVQRCFSDYPHLRDPDGSLAHILLAYTAMVPDIRYRTGLTRIAGHLLLQAPDEDAFWIFVAVMDSHLRGYYHVSNTGQFEIDSSIFQSLLESAEPELAHMLFNDCGVRPVDICGLWFSCLFAGILPADHLYRVWDVLFYEGPIYLFRVTLALITLCKRPLMTINPARGGHDAVLELLRHPPLSALPQDPDSFISHTFTIKVRDDDLRKQRTKREAQWKKDRLGQR